MWSKRLLRLSLNFCAKKVRYTFEYASSMIPHPQKAHKGGEDALYTSQNLLVVADGVGGWAEQGIDPGKYSKKLCQIISELMKSQNKLNYINEPKKLLIDAHKLNKEIGSTTVCLAALHPQTGQLNSYYIGDSVYGIFKSSGTALIAPQQQKSFNFPYQIGSQGDSPSSGKSLKHNYSDLKNNLLLLATDGLWDNINPSVMFMVLNPFDQIKNKLKQKCETIAQYASFYSLKENYSSPFHQKATKAGLNYPKEGKPDDITIILARVVEK